MIPMFEVEFACNKKGDSKIFGQISVTPALDLVHYKILFIENIRGNLRTTLYLKGTIWIHNVMHVPKFGMGTVTFCVIDHPFSERVSEWFWLGYLLIFENYRNRTGTLLTRLPSHG